MTQEEQAELSARRALARRGSEFDEIGPVARLKVIEAIVQRRLIAAMLPGGLVEYRRIIEAEVRK